MVFKTLMKRKKTELILFLTLIGLIFTVLHSVDYNDKFFVKAQDNPQPQWLTYDKALTKSKVENIPTLIYFYSDNCGWCRKMETETFANKEIQELLNNSFALVKINGNSNKTVQVEDEKLTERQLATEAYRVNAFPTIWFLNSGNERIANLPGYVQPDVFLQILVYIKDDFYKKYTFQEYMELEKNK